MSLHWTEEEYRAHRQRTLAHEGQYLGSTEYAGLVSEKAFMAAVVRLAKANGYKVYHPFDSRKSAPGYPDLTMAKPGCPVIFAELKVEGEKPTIEQQAWLDTLRQAQNTHVFLWRPSDWPHIEEVLTHV